MKIRLFSVAVSCIMLASTAISQSFNSRSSIEIKIQYQELEIQLSQLQKFEKVAPTTLNKEALITKDDRDPLDIVLRRVNALSDYITENKLADISSLKKEFDSLKEKAISTDVSNKDERFAIYEDLCDVRRKMMFSNSQINFQDILFIKRDLASEPEMEGNHMCDQFFGFHAKKNGGLFILRNAFSNNPIAEDLLKDSRATEGEYKDVKLVGGFLSPELSFDAKEVMFSYTQAEKTPYVWNEKTTYKIFKVGINGENLTQLTSGTTNDFDPCYLPSGRIAFISERRGGYGRCHGRQVPSFTLHSMYDDGTDITRLSHHETNEWQPSLTNDGMILFTRWDYIDRGHGQAHHPWICFPDGRDPRDVHGNYVPTFESRANMELNLRAIPNSHKFVATTAGHHAQAYGSLILIDPNEPDDNAYAPLKRITPEQLFPETEYPTHTGEGMYATASPLSENLYLCVYSANANDGGRRTKHEDHNYGIYLIDAFGNKELIYRDENVSCYDPIPVVKRLTPPVIPHRTLVGLPPINGKKQPQTPIDKLSKTAQVTLVNVNNSRYPFPEGTKIKELRIVQLLPKTTPVADDPKVGYGNQKGLRQVLGSVPVAEDGSANFEMPVNIPVYFQAIDENGIAVQTMRSATWVAPGEVLSCKGCHENRWEAVKSTAFPMAMREKPSNINPEMAGSNPYSFPILVQSVLDKKCVTCHTENITKGVKGVPDLRKDPIQNKWYTSYNSLKPYVFYFDNEAFTTAETMPKQFGSYASKLYEILATGHNDVNLTKEELRSITLWLDTNANFFGSDTQLEDQLAGKTVYPPLE